MKEFIKKYKNEIIIAVSAISAIVASIMTMEGSNAVVCSILIAIFAVAIELLKNGFSENAIKLIANAIMIIIDEINKKNTEVMSTPVFGSKDLELEEIEARLKAGLYND